MMARRIAVVHVKPTRLLPTSLRAASTCRWAARWVDVDPKNRSYTARDMNGRFQIELLEVVCP